MNSERVARFFAPASIALVGASTRGLYPAGVLQDLQRYGFAGRIYPVNPRRAELFGLTCYPTLRALPERPDLAVIMVPRSAVLEVIDDCLALGVEAAVIITAGFRESDAEGAALEAELQARLTGRNLALLGPNCAGLANLSNGTVITRLPVPPQAGNVGFVSASGALMMALQGAFADQQLGLSRLASVGNQADITLADVLDYLVQDEQTRVIGAFLEGIQDGARFLRAATAARAAGKPLVLIKSGRTQAGQQAAATHTATLAGSDRIFQAACRQSGVIVVDDIDELVHTLHLFANWTGRYPAGRRLALVTQSGGMGSLTADLATLSGFTLPDLSAGLQAKLHAMEHLLSFADFANPADVRGAGAVGAEAASTLEPFLSDPDFDAVILLLAKSAVDEREVATAHALAELAANYAKPFCVVWVGQRRPQSPEQTDEPLAILAAAGIPVFTQPSACINALAEVVLWQEEQAKFERPTVSDAAAALESPVALTPGSSLGHEEDEPVRFLEYAEIVALLAAYDIGLIPGRMIANGPTAADAVVAAAAELGFPVAVKGLTSALTHKSDAGLVQLHLAGIRQVRAAAARIQATLDAEPAAALLVQRMADPGVEVLLGIENDAQFGPVIACGPGGLFVELLDDVALRLPPMTQRAAHGLIDATHLGRLLAGVRGQSPSDAAALATLLVKLSKLALDQRGRLLALDMNPVIVHAQGSSIVDVRVQWQGNF